MATVEDVRARKKIRSYFTKRRIDITGLNMQVMHGVAYFRGVLKPIKGGPTNLQEEMAQISGLIQKAGLVKSVVVDCAFRS
ncbi:MAG: hypothetical protein IH945_13280 [Armatimonadetes bacterium]|nr:hypothetical protein [Armatimonadota bacterium]